MGHEEEQQDGAAYPGFLEAPTRELRRINLLRTLLNKGKKKDRDAP
jgi:hypothetical protein